MSVVGLRTAALAAALLLAVLSRGDVIVLGVLLAVGAWRPVPAIAVLTALGAAAWRWSSTALEDIAGAQAVLGPAGVVDPGSAAVAAWLGALAVLLAAPDLRTDRGDHRDAAPGDRAVARVVEWLPLLAHAATAAVIVAGPSVGGDVWIRVVAVAAGVGAGASLRRWVPASRRTMVDAIAALAGLASLALVGLDAESTEGILDASALAEGVAVAVATGVLVWAAGIAVLHLPRGREQAS